MIDFCPYCKESISQESIFCIHCGSDLRPHKESLIAEKKRQVVVEKSSNLIYCTHCEKASPEGSNYCVHCGKKIETQIPAEQKETINVEQIRKGSFKKLSSLLNILFLLAATASIGGFIYFYVENKLKTPADKNPINEEIIDNLYRNTKYHFRIKFPETWEIKKGDGPNILVKATGANGSNINIYVKDLGSEFGDIDDLFTLDEWVGSIDEKFPSAKIISQREIHIDNRKGFFAQYSINYETLDQEVKMTFYNVALTNKRFMYVITAGSEESQFDYDKQILDQSVRTFVIEGYGTDVNPQNLSSDFQSDKTPFKADRNIEKKVNRPWFRNTLHGISFKTPKALEKQKVKAPVGYEDYIEKFNTYSSSENGISVLLLYAETKFTTYDKKEGLSSSISNMVNGMNGTDLVLDFYDVKNGFDDLRCSGSFDFQGVQIRVEGYIHWNGHGKFHLLTAMGEEETLQSMNTIMESIRINATEQ